MSPSGSALAIAVLDALDLPQQNFLDLGRPPLLVQDAVYVGAVQAELFRDLGHQFGVEPSAPKFLPQRANVCSSLGACTIVARHNDRVITPALMPVKPKISKGMPAAKPDWANKIEAARKKLGWSQAELARRCRTSAMAVSRWERGENEPPGHAYVVIATSVGDPDGWYFLERIGLTKTEIVRLLPDLEERLFARGETKVEIITAPGATRPGTLALKRRPDAVAVPLLKDSAAAGSPRLIEEAQIERVVIADRHDCPHPQNTTCIRVSGRSMYPVLDDGYIVAVDTFVTDAERLVERMVAARDPDGAITIKWLRKVGDDYMLLPQHVSPEYSPSIISREPGWKIVGEVIWWIGRPK